MSKTELNWHDMELVVLAEGSIYDECGNADKVLEKYPSKEDFYGEVMKRYNELKNGND